MRWLKALCTLMYIHGVVAATDAVARPVAASTRVEAVSEGEPVPVAHVHAVDNFWPRVVASSSIAFAFDALLRWRC